MSDGSADGVTNQLSGIAQNVVQAGVISGGIHFHQPEVRSLPVPQQLPPDVDHFTNRQIYLAELDRVFEHEKQSVRGRICVVVGPPGVGKSALVTRWACRVKKDFPDGNLHIDLRGFGSKYPVTPDDVLDGFLRAFDVPGEKIPDGLAARTALYRSLLAERRVIVVLDNAKDPEQVRPLLPGSSTSLTLITSRSRLSGLAIREGARRVMVEPLSPDHAVELLRQVVGARRVAEEPEAASELAHRCGYLPLALRIAAERIAALPHMTLADIVNELADEQDRLDALEGDSNDETASIRPVFSWSYDALSPKLARTFRLLGLHPGPDISVAAAAALVDATKSKMSRMLDGLAGEHLLEMHARGRYRFHDLLRAYAAEQAVATDAEHDRDQAIDRLLDYYIYNARAADRLINLLGRRSEAGEPAFAVETEIATHAQAIEWMETERDNINACLRLATETARGDRVTSLARALVYYLRLKGYWSEALGLCQRISTLCVDLGDRIGAADMQFYAGDIHRLRGQRDEALQQYENALSVYQESGDRLYEARTLHSVGDLFRSAGRYDEALERYEAAQSAYREVGNTLAETRAKHSIADAYRIMGRHEDALTEYHRILPAYRDRGDAVGETRVRHSIGDLLHLSGNHQDALEHCEQALNAYQLLGDQLGEADSWHSLGDIYRAMRQQPETSQAYRRSLAAYKMLGDRHGESKALHSLGIAAEENGQTDAAHAFFREELAILEELGHPMAEELRNRLGTAE